MVVGTNKKSGDKAAHDGLRIAENRQDRSQRLFCASARRRSQGRVLGMKAKSRPATIDPHDPGADPELAPKEAAGNGGADQKLPG